MRRSQQPKVAVQNGMGKTFPRIDQKKVVFASIKLVSVLDCAARLVGPSDYASAPCTHEIAYSFSTIHVFRSFHIRRVQLYFLDLMLVWH